MVDPLVALLVGALGGALITTTAGFVGAGIQARREHARWIRQERLAAYTAWMNAMDRLPMWDDPSDRMLEYIDMQRPLTLQAEVVGSARIQQAIGSYRQAVYNMHTAWAAARNPDVPLDGPVDVDSTSDQFAITRAVLLRAIRDELRIRD